MLITARTTLMAALICILLPAVAPAAPATAPATQPMPDISLDARVELVSLICRLAGNPEYSNCLVKSYADDADRHFAAVRDHAVVKLARQLRRTRGVSFDAPMSLTVHLSEPPDLKELVALDPMPADVDARWRPAEAREFLAAARDFVKESKFDEFFRAHQKLYDESAARMTATIRQHSHLEWFDGFFGARPGAHFHIVLGMFNGGSCYGTRIASGEREDLYCILGVWQTDRAGVPVFEPSVLPTVVHEFCHSYANPLVEAHLKDMKKAGEAIFPKQAALMRRQAYGSWDTMMRESLVRACVVRYRAANDSIAAAVAETLEQHNRGFPWTGQLSGLLAEYEQHRDKYPTLEAFMPKIVEFFNAYAEK